MSNRIFVVRPNLSRVGSFCELKIEHKKVYVPARIRKSNPAPSVYAEVGRDSISADFPDALPILRKWKLP